MNRQFLLVAGILVFSVAASSFAQSPPGKPWAQVEDISNAADTPCLTDNGSGQILGIFVTPGDVFQSVTNPTDGSTATNSQGSKVTQAKVPPFNGPNSPLFGNGTACAVSNGEISLFGRQLGINTGQIGGSDSSKYWNTISTIQTKQGSFTKADWKPFPGDLTTKVPMSAASDMSQNIHLLARRDDDRLLYESVGADGKWGQWSQIDPTFMTNRGPVAVAFRDMLFAFAIGAADQQAYVNTQTLKDGKWSGWKLIPGNQVFNESLAATTDGQNTIWVFGIDHAPKIGCDGCGPIIANHMHIQVDKRGLPSKGWLGWQPLAGGGETNVAPAAGFGYVAMVVGNKVYLQQAPK
jgi:hypothetical protein